MVGILNSWDLSILFPHHAEISFWIPSVAPSSSPAFIIMTVDISKSLFKSELVWFNTTSNNISVISLLVSLMSKERSKVMYDLEMSTTLVKTTQHTNGEFGIWNLNPRFLAQKSSTQCRVDLGMTSHPFPRSAVNLNVYVREKDILELILEISMKIKLTFCNPLNIIQLLMTTAFSAQTKNWWRMYVLVLYLVPLPNDLSKILSWEPHAGKLGKNDYLVQNCDVS